ncbi:Hypothetical_protein [Hexamita inflata]|uniref:Hypothetical_protein n=1 Tax=Hexamita inflata TaxID=28002 RepID=A0AA86V0X3_9EUKA|nr:Hypothetical protein HINF_LOCUS59597 [Hexamita inflata]
MSFTSVNISSKVNNEVRCKYLEFVLQQCQTDIQAIFIDYCIIDLGNAIGDFKDITFNNCELKNELTNSFKAVSLNLNSNLNLSQLKSGLIQNINVNVNKNAIIDFNDAKQIQNLNKLLIQSTSFDLNFIEGKWNIIEIQDCLLENKILNNELNNFVAKQFILISNDQNMLKQLHKNNFNDLLITIFNQELLNYELLRQLKWKTIQLTLQYMKVDMSELTGRFTELTLNQCTLLNYGTEKLTCQQLNVLNCKQYQLISNTSQFQKINCQVLKVQQCLVNYLPLNLLELHIDACSIKLKSQCNYLHKITLKRFEQLNNLDMSLLPVICEITSDRKCDTIIYVQKIIALRAKYHKIKQMNLKRVQNLIVKRDIRFQYLDELDDELFYCIASIVDNFISVGVE